MPGPLVEAGHLIISVLFGIAITMVLLRVLLQMVGADFYNPLSQAVVKVTNPVLVPLRRVIPGMFKVDMASVLLMLVLQAVELVLLRALLGAGTSPVGLPFAAIMELVAQTYWIFLIAIILQVILSWVSPGAYNPATQLLYSLTRPLLYPLKGRAVIGGLDFSPLVIILAMQLAHILLIRPLRAIAFGML